MSASHAGSPAHRGAAPAPSRSYVRPGFVLRSLVNPIVRRIGRVPALIVRGRRSGALLTIPLGEPLELDGRRYLVSGRGETHWVRNLRAASRASFRLHGRTVDFVPVELHGPDQERVVAAYRQRLGRSVDELFRQIPDPTDHPVFRMDPIDAGQDAPSP